MRWIFAAFGFLTTAWGGLFLVALFGPGLNLPIGLLPAWGAFSLLTVGSVTTIYAFGLPDRRPALHYAHVRRPDNHTS